MFSGQTVSRGHTGARTVREAMSPERGRPGDRGDATATQGSDSGVRRGVSLSGLGSVLGTLTSRARERRLESLGGRRVPRQQRAGCWPPWPPATGRTPADGTARWLVVWVLGTWQTRSRTTLGQRRAAAQSRCARRTRGVDSCASEGPGPSWYVDAHSMRGARRRSGGPRLLLAARCSTARC